MNKDYLNLTPSSQMPNLSFELYVVESWGGGEWSMAMTSTLGHLVFKAWGD